MGQALRRASLACATTFAGWVTATTFAGGCGAEVHPPVAAPRARQNVLALIEGRASECLWADPAQLSSEERALFAALMPSDAIAFEAQVAEYARCVAQTDDGVVETTVVRLNAAARTPPRFASRDADWVRPDTLMWRVAAPHGVPLGEDVRRMAVRAVTSEARPFLVVATSPTATSLTIWTTYARESRGVRVATDHTGGMPDVPEEDVPFAVEMLLTMNAQATQTFGARMQEQAFGHAAHYAWSMLQLEANDGALVQAARSRSHARIPLASIDPARLDLIRAEALQQCTDARRTLGDERAVRMRECALFYSYLYMREERLVDAQQAIAAWREAGSLEEARALASRAYADAPSDPRARALWIENAGADLALAWARIHPELSLRERQRFLRHAASYLAEGLSGLVVEGSFLASLPSARVPELNLAAAVELPAESLVDLAYVLLRAEGGEGSLSVRVEGNLREDAPSVTLGLGARWDEDVPVWAAALAEPTFARVRPLSHALAAQLAMSGEARLVVMLGARRLSWSLRSEGARVLLEADSTRRDWTSLARDVALPLAQLPTTRFPLPSLSLSLPEETLAALSPMLASTSGIQCTTTLTTLHCAAREAGPDALLDVLVELARILAR